MSPQRSEWIYLIKEFFERLRALFTQPRAFLYVFVFGALLGGLGTWGALFAQSYGKATGREVIISATTFGVALCFTGIADSVLEKEKQGIFRFASLVFGILSLLPIAFQMFELIVGDSAPIKTETAWTLILIAPPGLVWAVANARDAKFTPEWDAPAGGSPNRELEDKK